MEATKNLSQLFLFTSPMATLFLLLFVGQAVMATNEQPLWQGRITAEIHGPPAESVWPFFADFCNLYKIFPLAVSFCVEGVPGRIGQHRYVAAPVASPSDGNTTYVRWEKHNLTAIDPIKRTLSYEILENNLVVKTYRSTMSVLPSEYGSRITWEYTIDPIGGVTSGQFHGLLQSIFQRAKEKIENTYINLV